MSDVSARLAAALAGRYTVERELGRGGMATVFLAHDDRHGRDVALKVLHPDLGAALGPERFLAEIRTTARLQHPHILPLLDSGTADGLLFYVMPFVAGETLRARLERERQLPVADAVQLAREVADALGHAHALGVIHRDIKPENILLQGSHALVADFGIALAVQQAGGQRMTQTGLSLGTPQYMSPEQAMGEKTLDARSDLYALGAVAYEMLTGEPPFTGATVQAIVAKLLTERPTPPSTVRDTVPAHVERAVLTALAKLPADRFASAMEFAAALTTDLSATRGGSAASAPAARRGLWRLVLPLAGGVLALAGAALVGRALAPAPALSAPPGRFLLGGVRVGAQPSLGVLALSPDGRTVAYLGDPVSGNSLWVRRIDATRGVMLPNTSESFEPTFSPDGNSLLFARADIAYRISLAGGEPIAIPGLSAIRPGFLWLRDGTIVFRTDDGGLSRIPQTGGEPTRIGTPDTASGELRQTAVAMLDDGRHLLVLGNYTRTASRLYALDLRSGRRTVLIESGVAAARFLPPGHILYADDRGALLVVPLDVRTLRLGAPAVRVADGIQNTTEGAARFATSASGAVVYLAADAPSLALVERSGASQVVSDLAREYHNPRFAPDGRRILVDVQGNDASRDAWILDLDQRSFSRATFTGDGHDAIWSRDGRSILFQSERDGMMATFRTSAMGGGDPQRVAGDGGLNTVTAVTPDGTLIGVGTGRRPGSGWDLIAMRPSEAPHDVLATAFADAWPALSPDGRWLAYASDESGVSEVYVRRLDGEGGRLQVSTDGATEPLWGPSGRELFYRRVTGTGSELMVADMTTSPEPRVRGRRTLFVATDYEGAVPHTNYDISPDGRRFAMVHRTQARGIVYLQNVVALARTAQEGK